MQTNKKPRIIGAVLTTALLCTTGVACSGGDSDAKSDGSSASPAKVLTAAFKKTTDAKSAKVQMTMKMPGTNGGGDLEMAGVVGWEPSVMDVTLQGSALSGEPDAPDESRLIHRDGVMYLDLGAEGAKQAEGKRWMKMDLKAMAEEAEKSGDPAPGDLMTKSLENVNQDPAQQIALLLESPSLKRVGTQKIDGAEAGHYKGKLTVAEMLKTNDALADVMDEKERKALLKNLEKAGVKGYDIDVWVNGDELPVRMDVKTKSPQGDIDISTKYSDYGTEVKAETPKASETLDLLEMFKKLDKEDPA